MSLQVKKQTAPAARYTGVCPFQVIAINPSKAELEALGINMENEPTYKGNKEGVDTLRIDFWLKNSMVTYTDPATKKIVKGDAFITKASYWLENTLKKSSTGKFKIINNSIQDTWAESLEALKNNPNMMKWFSEEGMREAYVGEVEFLNVLWKWLGYSYGNKSKGVPADQLRLSKSISDIITSGDLSEIKALIQQCLNNGNGIKFLCGVVAKDDGKIYQTLYTSFPMTPATKTYDKLSEALAGEYNQFKADYQNSFEFMVYTGSPSVTPDSSESTSSSSFGF